MDLSAIQFVRDGALLSFRGPVSPEWELITDFSVAQSRAFDQSDDFPNWCDLREHVSAESGAWRMQPEGLLRAVGELVSAYTPVRYAELEDEILADLSHHVSYELNREREERLYPMLFAAYAAGGWPCGWSGEYPSGKLCVYWAEGQIPSDEPATAHERRVVYQKQKARERLG
jgi:hypothetical protein